MRTVLLILALVLAATVRPALAETVTISHAGATLLRVPLYIAIQKGFFRDEGLELQVVETRSGSDAIKMLAGGAVDFSVSQLIDDALLNKRGISARGIAMLSSRLTNSLVVRKGMEDQIKTVADIKGHNLGVTGIGSGTWQFAIYVTKLAGLKQNDFNVVSVGPGAPVMAAVKAGSVDVMSYADPEDYQLVAAGDAAYMIDMTDEATHKRLIGDSYVNNLVIAREEFLRKSPKAAAGFVNAIQRALAWAKGRPGAEIAQVIHDYPAFRRYEMAPFAASVQKMLPAGLPDTAVVTRDAYDNAIKLAVAVGALDAPPPFEQLIDNSFAEQAATSIPH